MPTRKPIIALLLVLVTCGPTIAQDAGDPIIRLDSRSTTELDLGVMVDDLMPRLLAIIAEEDGEADAEEARRIFELIGLEALGVMKCESRQTRDRSTAEFEISLDPEYAETALYRLLTTPNGSCDFARHVSRDELVFFLTIHNFPHYLEVLLDFIASPEVVEMMGEVPVNEAGDLALGNFAPRTDLLPLLSGEVDLFFLDAGEDAMANPMAAPYFLVLGANDGFALRDRILEIAGMLGGGDMAAMLDAIEPETVGAFELKALPFGGAFAVSADFLVIGMSPDRMREVLAARGDLDVPDGIEWAYMNGSRYGAYMESVMGMAAMMDPDDMAETAWLMDVYDVLFDHIEFEEVLWRSRRNGVEGTMEVRGPIMTGLYRMAVGLLERVPELMAMQEEEDEEESYREAIMMVDEAMMAWAAGHDGTYPADPVELLDAGYVQEWPFEAETAPGEFVDWAYTYHPYFGEEGTVVGYIFFLYGDEEKGGYDVYTAENLAADGPFAPASDGVADGVVSFCYDGVALDIIDAFFGR